MSIIKKEKTTEEYKRKLENLPQSTRNNRIDAVNKFQRFCKENHNSTPEEICNELVILKNKTKRNTQIRFMTYCKNGLTSILKN